MRQQLLALAFLVSAACGPVHPTTQPHPGPVVPAAQAKSFCIDIWQQELGRMIDPGALVDCQDKFARGLTDEQIREPIRKSPEWAEFHKPKPAFVPLPRLTTDGYTFQVAGKDWTWKGVSAFKLMHRWVNGENITPYLDAFKGANILRVWLYVEGPSWGDRGWPPPPPDKVVAFVKHMNELGWYIELTLLTSDSSQRVEDAKATLAALAPVRETDASNLVIELANEPEVQTLPNRNYDTKVLKDAVTASGFRFASGNYVSGAKNWFGDYLTTHTARDGEWPRKAHDCFDYRSKPGDAPPGAIAVHAPCVLDEPKKPAIESDVLDYEAYCAAGTQMGAGCTFHFQGGLTADLPTDLEQRAFAAALRGMNAFPPGTTRGGYFCVTCPGGPGDKALRTYVIGGNTMTRIRPTTLTCPLPGFRSLDPDGILWIK